MSLKEKVEKAYRVWKQHETYNLSKIGSHANNYREISNNITRLKNDLCKFAQRFDERMAKISVINIKTLTCNTPYNLYKDIQSNFINKIAEEGNCILIGNEGETLKDAMTRYNDAIKKFHDKFEKLKVDFKPSRNLVELFREFSERFLNSGDNPKYKWHEEKDSSEFAFLNYGVESFVSDLMNAMYEELKTKDIRLIAEDEEYFDSEKTSPKRNSRHTIEPVLNPVKVFPGPQSPSLREVRQGKVGDCYLLGALMALAKTEPGRKAIKECFIQVSETVETDDKIDIRFFYLKNKIKKQITITVDKRKVISPESIKDAALWPKLIEKAYAVYRHDGYESTISNALDRGYPESALFAITGKESRSLDKEEFSSKDIIKTIIKKLEKQRAIVCSFHPKGPLPFIMIKDAKRGEDTYVMCKHAYAIVGVDKTKKYIRLVEPNKAWGRDPATNSKNKEGGHIAISFERFKKLPYRIGYTTGKDI